MRTRSLIRFYLTVFMILGINFSLSAQDKVWTGAVDSSWHNAGNWSPTGVPASGHTVVLRGNTTPYPVITSNVAVRSVTINDYWSNPGDQLKIRNNATLTITDDLIINGAGQLNIINGHVDMTATSGGQNKFDVNSVESEINITNGSFTAGTVSEDVDVEIIGTFNLGNGILNVQGDFNISNSDTFNAEDGTVNIYGNTTVNGTYNGDDGLTNFNGDVEVRSGGILNLSSGTINFNGVTTIGNNGTTNFGTGTVTINSDLDVGSGGYFNVQDADVIVTGDAAFTSNGNMTVDNGSITVGGNASLSSGGTIDLNSGSLNVGGDASFTSGGTVNAGDATITLEGDFTVQNGSNFAADSSTVVFSGDSTQTVNTKSDLTFYNVQVDSGAVFNTDGGSQNTVTIEGNLIVDEDGGVVVDGDDQLDIQGEVGGGGAGNVSSPAPFAVSANAPSLTSVVITFNKAMVEIFAENTANYVISQVSNPATTLSISSATLNTSGDSTQVTLGTSTITEDIEYKITMNNLESADGGILSANHVKRFTKFGAITFYSLTSGNWSSNSTWSRVSHSGPVSATNPSTISNAIIIVGDGDIVTITGATSIQNQVSVTVSGGSKLTVGSGGNLSTGTKIITGSGTFEVTAGTLQIGSPGGISSSGPSGNIQTATRSFGTGGSYVYNGTIAQITGTGLPSSVANLTVNNANNVHVTDDLEVTGLLTLTIGSMIINSGKNLIANTKSIGSGNLIMRQTITGTNGWRLLSSPIASTYADLFDSTVTQGYPGAYYSTGSNPGDTLQPNVLYYLESYPGTDNQRWRAPSDASNSLSAGRGLFTYIFGDIDADPLYNDILPLPATLEIEGQENEGPVDFGVTYTTSADSGWNFIGNPYAATIDWDDASNWTKTNIDNTLYIWDYATNQYKTWNGTIGDLGSGLIAPFQGFWVKANGESPVLVADEKAKTTGGLFIGKSKPEPSRYPSFTVTLGDDNHETSTHFMFTPDARLDKDENDAYRLLPLPGIGNYLELSSLSQSGDKYAINNLPRAFGKPIEIPLNIEAYKNGYADSTPLNFEFRNFSHIPDGWTITIIDREKNIESRINAGKTYPFQYKGKSDRAAPNRNVTSRPKVTSTASASDVRFLLRISPGEDAGDLPGQFNLEQNYPNPFNPTTNIRVELPVQSYVELTIFDMLGREVSTLVRKEISAGTHTFTWNADRYSSGLYLYRLVTSEKVITKKMTLIK